MPDPKKPTTGADPAEKTPAAETAEMVAAASAASAKEIADVFRKELEADRASRTDKPAPAPAPAGMTAEQHAAKQAELLETYQKMCDENRNAEALAWVMSENAKLQAAISPHVDETKSAGFKSLYSINEREAKRSHADIFKLYGPEVKAEMEAMPAADRLDPEMWEEGIRRVRARHIEEIIDARVEAATKQATAPTTLQNSGSIGTSSGDEEEIVLEDGEHEAAGLFGMSEEQYLDAKKKTEASRIRRGFHRGMVSLVPEHATPGRF